jgi:dipeptidyl aminopeptidase/acylaminoacyl peptidase
VKLEDLQQEVRKRIARFTAEVTAAVDYLRNPYPLLHADRIKTPTLFLCGDRDFNVPLLNSEQMYQALRSLGIDTQLVIYPGQYHGLRKPSYLRDRMQRYLDWYRRYLLGPEAVSAGAQ